jgi:hypothetical protein
MSTVLAFCSYKVKVKELQIEKDVKDLVYKQCIATTPCFVDWSSEIDLAGRIQ